MSAKFGSVDQFLPSPWNIFFLFSFLVAGSGEEVFHFTSRTPYSSDLYIIDYFISVSVFDFSFLTNSILMSFITICRAEILSSHLYPVSLPIPQTHSSCCLFSFPLRHLIAMHSHMYSQCIFTLLVYDDSSKTWSHTCLICLSHPTDNPSTNPIGSILKMFLHWTLLIISIPI